MAQDACDHDDSEIVEHVSGTIERCKSCKTILDSQSDSDAERVDLFLFPD